MKNKIIYGLAVTSTMVAMAFASVNAPSGAYFTKSCTPSNCAVTLTWSDNSNNETSFDLEYSLGGGSGIVSLPANTTTITVNLPPSCSTLTSRLRSVNGAEQSSWSNLALIDINYGSCGGSW